MRRDLGLLALSCIDGVLGRNHMPHPSPPNAWQGPGRDLKTVTTMVSQSRKWHVVVPDGLESIAGFLWLLSFPL